MLYKRGNEIANKNGLILVDTKYEFGYDANGEITLIDEIHTRFLKIFIDTYEDLQTKGQNKNNYLKNSFVNG